MYRVSYVVTRMVKLEVRGPRVRFDFGLELVEEQLSLMHLDDLYQT
jgi:hypothetical protein